MIKIIYDAGVIEAGGSVFHINNNILDRVRVSVPDNTIGVVNINITDYEKDHEFDVSTTNTLVVECVVIKLDAEGNVHVEQMSEQSFMSRKHLQ